MSSTILIPKSQIVKEPEYNCLDEELGNSARQCPSKSKENQKEIQKVKTSYFTDMNGKRIDKITIEKEVILVLELQNMTGEELIIELPFEKGFCKFEGKEITCDNALKVSVSSDKCEIKLSLMI